MLELLKKIRSANYTICLLLSFNAYEKLDLGLKLSIITIAFDTCPDLTVFAFSLLHVVY